MCMICSKHYSHFVIAEHSSKGAGDDIWAVARYVQHDIRTVLAYGSFG